MTKPSILELPRGVQLIYLAEGGANVIYRFATAGTTRPKDPKGPLTAASDRPDQPSSLPARLQGKLLRLRKATAADISYTEIVRNFDTIIRPLFAPEELVDQTLVQLPDGLLARCNEQLRAEEVAGSRPKKRHGGYLCLSEPFGLLITDMTTGGDLGATLAEFKPKWLNQSPSAPAAAHRCRTCALREMKNSESLLLGQKEQRSFCPLDLVSEKFDNVLRATALIKGCKDRSRLARILYSNSTLRTLQSLQKIEGDVGLQGPGAKSRDMSLAMTLRDCTMFIKIPQDENRPVEIRLGDLDLKTGAGGKAGYWRSLETQLIDQGWYHGCNSTQDPSECALFGSRRSSHSYST
ncbi:uncharacterized protein N7511_001072 [Penicillium nucicola]|uniref:uncharacterized protein n=1 Tax=Penicillium nucicola TaxID=1850975 RepID=UPI002545A971|nr:uncharacterized protein N7511_001072 [Penicillium nucicola]KAJ5776061.1 hypothetical protein N7511_001072 [Penicillium nucicola]